MATVFDPKLYGRFTELQNYLRRKNLLAQQGSNFVGGSFSNRGNVRALFQFRKEKDYHSILKFFFLENRPIHFQINSASLIRLVKQNQLSFSSIEIKKPSLYQSTVSYSDSSSETNSSCCHSSDA